MRNAKHLEARPGEDPSDLGDELRTAAFSAAARWWRDSLSGAAPDSNAALGYDARAWLDRIASSVSGSSASIDTPSSAPTA